VVAAVAEEGKSFSRSDRINGLSNGVLEGLFGACAEATEQSLDFGEGQLTKTKLTQGQGAISVKRWDVSS
jgi:hypothetical protein